MRGGTPDGNSYNIAVLLLVAGGGKVSVAVPAAREAPPRSRLGAAWARAWHALAAQLDAEQGRWFLWLPVFFGAGIGIYFELLEEPDASLSLGLFIATLALRMLARTSLFAFLITSILLCMSAGFSPPRLERPSWPRRCWSGMGLMNSKASWKASTGRRRSGAAPSSAFQA